MQLHEIFSIVFFMFLTQAICVPLIKLLMIRSAYSALYGTFQLELH